MSILTFYENVDSNNRKGKAGQLSDRFEIRDAVLAQRAEKILGQGIALVEIAAHFAHIALFAVCLGLRLHVLLIPGRGQAGVKVLL